MKWMGALFCWAAASYVLAGVPTDLQSPFLKTVIYQKKIAGYGAGSVEQKEVTAGVKKDDLYEFRKADGTLFLVSESEVLGVLPVFPSLENPCEKRDVEAAISFLEKARQVLPEQPEVSATALEKWKSLALVFGEIESEWGIPSASLSPHLENLFLVWAFGLPGLSFLGIASGLILLRRKACLACVLILAGFGGGLLFWASLQPLSQVTARQNPSQEDLCRRVFWAVSCGKKAGLLQKLTEFRVPADEWLNFLFQRIRFPEPSAGPYKPALTQPFFQKQAGGVMVQQPVQVGPLQFPLAFAFSAPEGIDSPEQLVVKKMSVGWVPAPQKIAESWAGKIFQAYRFIWHEVQDKGAVKWKVAPDFQLEIQISPQKI